MAIEQARDLTKIVGHSRAERRAVLATQSLQLYRCHVIHANNRFAVTMPSVLSHPLDRGRFLVNPRPESGS